MQDFIKIKLNRLAVNIPERPFGNSINNLGKITADLNRLSTEAGTDNEKYKTAWKQVITTLKVKQSLLDVIKSKLEIRALSFALSSPMKSAIKVTPALLERIDQITHNKPGNLFIESLFQYYLNEFNSIYDLELVSNWLVDAREFRDLNSASDRDLISPSGPKWLAESAIKRGLDFDQLVSHLNLDKFKSGQFMELAQRTYYVEQLKTIPLNEPNDLLIEVQKPEVFNARFNDTDLLGHQILNILIERSPTDNIHESWLNVIMAIAGDPRIPTTHHRYIKWWSRIASSHIARVRGWLSRLDLKLFLEALEDFSNSSFDPEMKRMYPSRKRFLEGLYDKKLISNTRLYMSRQMSEYLKRNYKAEHLPNFSIIKDNDKSIIYVDLGSAHLVEGSHSCYLWVYDSLDPSATVYDYNKNLETYSGLTAGLNRKMQLMGHGATAKITHSPANFSWQRKAIDELNYLDVDVNMKDVLINKDYSRYVRMFGVD